MYEDLVELIDRTRVAFVRDGKGVSESTIARAEASLDIPLPASYKWWLAKYGGGQIKDDILYGLDEDGKYAPDIVELARMNERDGMCGIERLVFSTGNAETFYFDTSDSKDDEYRVFQHDISQDDVVLYSNDFAEFLRRRIRQRYGIKD